MDRRQNQRTPLMVELTYVIDGVAIVKTVTDLSAGGLFVDTPVPSEIGTELELHFIIDGDPIEARGTVIYAQPFIGMGVQFTYISDEARGRIDSFVAQHAPQLVT